jgi:hypothetical protein
MGMHPLSFPVRSSLGEKKIETQPGGLAQVVEFFELCAG